MDMTIVAGLRKAMAVLSRGGQDPAGGVIMLVSDGKENRPPWLANVRDQVIRRLMQ